MNKSYLTSRYIKRMQNGGGAGNVGVQVASPNPQPFVAPLQGLNPNVFKYEVNTKPLDTSPIIQVMQTKDSLEVQREKIAIERQENQIRKEIADKQLEFQEFKYMNELAADMFKASGGGQYTKDGSLVFNAGDNSNTPRVMQMNAPIQAKIDAEQEKFIALAKMPYGTPGKAGQVMQIQNNIRKLQQAMIPQPALRIDEQFRTGVLEALSDPDSKVGVSQIQARKFLDKSDAWYQLRPEGNDYKPGIQEGIVYYNKVETAKQFDKIVETALAATKITDVVATPTNGGGQVITEQEKNITSAPKVAAKEIVTNIMGNKQLQAYAENVYGMDLASDDAIHLLYERVAKDLEASEARRLREMQDSETYKGAQGPTNKTSTSRIIYEGGVDSTQTKSSTYKGSSDFKSMGGKGFDVDSMSGDDINNAANAIVSQLVGWLDGNAIGGQNVNDSRAVLARTFIEAGGDPNNKAQMDALQDVLLGITSTELASGQTKADVRDLVSKNKTPKNLPNRGTTIDWKGKNVKEGEGVKNNSVNSTIGKKYFD